MERPRVNPDLRNIPAGTKPGTNSSSEGGRPEFGEGPERAGDRFVWVPLAPARGAYERWGKRLLDLVAAGLGLLLLSPLIFLISLAIKLDSPGPVLYRSIRVRDGGLLFAFAKFRSMVRNAEELRSSVAHLNEVDGPVFKITRDPRTTRVGALLRRTSLDELPQLWHVLRGEMSLVGPRPLPVEEVHRFDDDAHRRRLSVLPGLTCHWQVRGRNEIDDFAEWVRLDLEYIDNWSLWLDLQILWRTLPAVVVGTGAK